jgi:hypothetical protein
MSRMTGGTKKSLPKAVKTVATGGKKSTAKKG